MDPIKKLKIERAESTKKGCCHQCRKQKRLKQCYNPKEEIECRKGYCNDCLQQYYQTDFNKISQQTVFICPFKKNQCKCSNCISFKSNKQSRINWSKYQQKITLKSKMKKLIEFNQQLILKVSKIMSSKQKVATRDEVMFYNNIILNNLTRLEKVADYVQDNLTYSQE